MSPNTNSGCQTPVREFYFNEYGDECIKCIYTSSWWGGIDVDTDCVVNLVAHTIEPDLNRDQCQGHFDRVHLVDEFINISGTIIRFSRDWSCIRDNPKIGDATLLIKIPESVIAEARSVFLNPPAQKKASDVDDDIEF